jgi:hypothetical protein
MTERVRLSLGALGQILAILALGLAALLAYSEARYVERAVWQASCQEQDRAVATVREQAAGSTAEIRGQIHAIRVGLDSQAASLQRIEHAVDRLATGGRP